jgi:cytoskeleton protein RodZ
MDDLGNRLRRAREERGLTLKDIATRTKMSVMVLEALERNDFSRLPGGIFSRSFARAYAIEVGLEPEAVVEEFLGLLREAEREAAERKAVRPEVTADDREFLERQRRALRILKIVGGLLAAAALAALVWQIRSMWAARSGTERPTPPSASTPAQAPVPPTTSVAP